jgi:predicted tellurium resistance membrane protein TerC
MEIVIMSFITNTDFIVNIILPLLSLTAIEIVLGIDNIIFLTLLVDKLPSKYQPKARSLGLLFAMVTRIALLYSITWVMAFNHPLLVIWAIPITGKAIILILGGFFLVIKSIGELFYSNGSNTVQQHSSSKMKVSFWVITNIIIQIAVMDIIFSLDSIITAVGLVNNIKIMVCAIVIAVMVMLLAAKSVGDFINKRPQLRCHALCFLILVGISLIAEGFGLKMSKSIIYITLVYSLFVEFCIIKLKRFSR